MQKWKLWVRKTADMDSLLSKNMGGIDYKSIEHRFKKADKNEIGKKRVSELFTLGQRDVAVLIPFLRMNRSRRKAIAASLRGQYVEEVRSVNRY